ncbi:MULTISPECIES: S8 family serine peptidase [Methylomonas]|uniref:Subtilisin family serine protease n=1 Tax=Methylomonas methanica TaxID=421 RepID=A0ABY2CP07_METMH|nr:MULTISPECIES: S8 family serine peptidase [Methylomonas]TCV85456.1 subtilisin family serine protease [Methylomonas methanica]
MLRVKDIVVVSVLCLPASFVYGQAFPNPAVSLPAGKAWKSGQILVQPKAGLPKAEFEKILRFNGSYIAENIGSSAIHIINVPENAEAAVARALSKNPHIEFAELDMAVPLSAVPNDPQFANAWHLSKIQSPNAWDVSKADGITIAILDSGVDGTHPDLAAHMVPGWNAVDSGSVTADINGHGTAVAGAAAAVTNNASGVAGVAWNAKIMPIRITNDAGGYAYWSDVARGLNWAVDNGADVANLSYAASDSATVASAAQYMRSKGGLVLVAAGNDGLDPGLADNINLIVVSATDANDAKASFSNYGKYIDVAAPGVSILTTNNGGTYAAWYGTSLATPVAAGVVALIQAANPKLTPDNVEKILKSSADKVSGVNFDPNYGYGYGRVNAANAIKTAINTVSSDSQAPIAAILSPSAGSVVSGLASVAVAASDNVSVSQVSLFANGALVGTDGVAPYQFSWDTSSSVNGNVNLTATAIDSAGNSGSSTAVTVSVQNQSVTATTGNADVIAPMVNISNPVNGSKVSGLVAVSVSAKDNVAVAKVQIYIDAKLVASTTGNSLSYNWNAKKALAGSHTIKSIATDTSGNTGTVSIQVTK